MKIQLSNVIKIYHTICFKISRILMMKVGKGKLARRFAEDAKHHRTAGQLDNYLIHPMSKLFLPDRNDGLGWK